MWGGQGAGRGFETASIGPPLRCKNKSVGLPALFRQIKQLIERLNQQHVQMHLRTARMYSQILQMYLLTVRMYSRIS